MHSSNVRVPCRHHFCDCPCDYLGFFSGKYCDGKSPELAGANGSSVPAARLLVVGFEAMVEKLGPISGEKSVMLDIVNPGGAGQLKVQVFFI